MCVSAVVTHKFNDSPERECDTARENLLALFIYLVVNCLHTFINICFVVFI